MKPTTITKSHPLITAKMSFTAKEQDLLNLILVSLKKEANAQKKTSKLKNLPVSDKNDGVHIDKLSLQYEYTRQELLDLLEVTPKRLTAYLDEATDELMEKVATVRNPNTGEYRKYKLVGFSSWEANVLTLSIDKEVAEVLLNYSAGFAVIDFKLMFALKNKNEKRILDLISRFKGKKNTFFKCRIKDLCEMLGVSYGDYANYNSFRIAVLSQPLARIIKASNGLWEYMPDCKTGIKIYKKGRSTTENDFVELRVRYVKQIEEEKQHQVDIPEELLELSVVVAAWRNGTTPTQMQAMDILMEIDELEKSELLTKNDFKKLRKAVPPQG